MSTPDPVAAYLARQAATVGRHAAPLATRWVPCLAGGGSDCLGLLQGDSDPAQGGQSPSLALHPDGRRLFTGHPDGSLRGWQLTTGTLLWQGSERHGGRVHDVAIAPNGQRLASVAADASLRLWHAHNGQCYSQCPQHRRLSYRVQWAPDSRRLATAGADETVRVWDSNTGKSLLRCRGHQESVWAVAWSPDGRRLASAAADRTIRLWDTSNGNGLHQWAAHDGWVVALAWSPDGTRLASLGNDHALRLWDTHDWTLSAGWTVHEQASHLKDLVWSPDGRWLATAARDGVIYLWEARSGRECGRYSFPEDAAWRLAWSADGTFLAASHSGDRFRLWDTRALAVAPPATLTLSPELMQLVAALAQLHRLLLYPSLALLRELLQLTGGRPGLLPTLAAHLGVRELIRLRWPVAARVGLVALLLNGLPADGWQPPADLEPAQLTAALAQALRGAAIPPQIPPPPLPMLLRNADAVDERLLGLLTLLGPAAVAADPGLPLRLRARLPMLPAWSVSQRRLLGRRLRWPDGLAQGSGPGRERVGIAPHGALRDLLPSQLALPPAVLHSREQRGELLYRARSGHDQDCQRPLLLVLDVSPPCFGAIEAMLRPAAQLLAASRLHAGQTVLLIAAGGVGQVRPLTQPADLLDVWTLRSLQPAAAAAVLHLAATLRGSWRETVLEPVIVVLSQPWFGSGEALPTLPGLRGLFVQYPGTTVQPTLAVRCERWESVDTGDPARLPELLTRLLG